MLAGNSALTFNEAVRDGALRAFRLILGRWAVEIVMSIDAKRLQKALKSRLPDPNSAADNLAIETMGDEAFDWIVEQVKGGKLSPGETVRGLGLLSRLTRQFCLRRKGELLEITLSLAQNEEINVNVRSSAVHIAMSNAAIAKGLKEPLTAFGRSAKEVRELVSSMLECALAIGVTPEVRSLAKEFLAHHTD